jgi:hypothetical protein
MAYAMVPIFTQTVASSVVSVVFNNIPSNYTDLKIVISARATSNSVGTGLNMMGFYLNTDAYPASSSFRSLLGTGSAVSSNNNSGYGDAGTISDSSQTANTFSNTEIYIPNYTASVFKQLIIDSVNENNATAAGAKLSANLYRNTAAINKIAFDTSNGAFAQYSTFTLYGIKNA